MKKRAKKSGIRPIRKTKKTYQNSSDKEQDKRELYAIYLTLFGGPY